MVKLRHRLFIVHLLCAHQLFHYGLTKSGVHVWLLYSMVTRTITGTYGAKSAVSTKHYAISTSPHSANIIMLLMLCIVLLCVSCTRDCTSFTGGMWHFSCSMYVVCSCDYFLFSWNMDYGLVESYFTCLTSDSDTLDMDKYLYFGPK